MAQLSPPKGGENNSSQYKSHLCHTLLLPSIFPNISVFSNDSALSISWPKYWSFSFRISPSNEYSGLISFRIDWFDLLAVQRTLKTLLQHLNFKPWIFFEMATYSSILAWKSPWIEEPGLWLFRHSWAQGRYISIDKYI